MNLRKHEWESLRTLADGPRVAPRGWAQQLHRLGERGLVERVGPYTVQLTEKGRVVLQEHDEKLDRARGASDTRADGGEGG